MQTNYYWKTTLLAGLLTLLAAGASIAQQMNYQGRLTDSAGNAVADAQYFIVFDIFDAATGGTKQWGPQTNPVDVVQGRFNTILGPTDAVSRNIINAFDGGTTRYLQITFQGNAILPRQQILAAPVAFRALISDTVTNGSIGTAQLADGSVTAAKISGGTGVWVGNGQNIYHDAGNVGIGTTNPAAKLDVNGNANITGNVGIGTAVPNAGLEVSGSAAKKVRVTSTGGGDVGLELFRNGVAFRDFSIVDSAGSLTIGVSYDDLATVTPSITVEGAANNVGIGTDTPAAKLQVVGDIKLGPSGQYFAPAAEENLRIVRGIVRGTTASGLNQGAGWTVSSYGGVTVINFATPFSNLPAVTVTAEGALEAWHFSVQGVTTSSVTVVSWRLDGAIQTLPFHFIAIGPR